MTTAVKEEVVDVASQNGHRGAKRTVEEIPVGQLVRVESVSQRPLIAAWVRELALTMDLDALHIFAVSRRDNGTDVLVDGGHRQAALLERDLEDWPVVCHVYHGLTEAEEAALFRRLNRRRKVSAIEDFLKGVIEGDGECVVINRIVKRAGLRVSRQVGAGEITCVAALRKVYIGRGSKVHPDALKATLTTATEAWGHTPEAVEGQVIHGLGEFFKRYGQDVEHDDLVKKLAKVRGGPSRLQANAQNLHDMTRRPVYRCVTELIVDTYNKGRRKNVLASL